MTPSYNQAAFLPATVASVINQDYPDLEYIIQDGGSTDETLTFLESLPPKVIWVSEKDDGQSDAVNRAWARASGEVLGWLNSDDLYRPGALRRVGEVFAAYPRVEWVIGRCGIIDREGGEIRRAITAYKNFLLARLSLPLLLLENPISQMAVFVRRTAIEAVGPLRIDLPYTMDYDFWLRLFQRSRPHVLEGVIADFRVHDASKSVMGFREQFAEQHRVASAHARSAGLGYLVPLRWLTAGKTVAAYGVAASLARLRGRRPRRQH